MTQDNAYKRTGVDIAAGTRATELMKAAVRATYTPEVLSETGSFGGLFAADSLKTMQAPVLVASTDGVGTKTMVAARMQQWDTIGQDLVNHCVNDILVQGARPLFFLDYVASSKLIPEQIAAVVAGCAEACKQVGCALLGGETAEMPGVYQPGEIDLVGTVVGVVDRFSLIDGSRIQPGDLIFALESTGLHTNGYSLARRVLESLKWHTPRDDLHGQSIGEALLNVHRCYLNDIESLRSAGMSIHGLAHITGGGVIDNLPRILPQGAGAVIQRESCPVPPIFRLIQQLGGVTDDEMYHVFNMGMGMLIVVPAAQAAQMQGAIQVGQIVEGTGGVELR
ncbi:MAG: phosphoribosylformylglycinamidine cyclo-ligase [bacterium]|nr:phosphoribosylformylglycinamidine cyclo-ligase [bacterium]